MRGEVERENKRGVFKIVRGSVVLSSFDMQLSQFVCVTEYSHQGFLVLIVNTCQTIVRLNTSHSSLDYTREIDLHL